MKRIFIQTKVMLLAAIFILASCESVKNANNTQKGAAAGAAAGAIIGGILGNNVGSKNNAALGAILGAAVGGVAGGVIGNKMDKQARDISNTLPGAKVERVGEGIRLVLDENAINFEFGKSSLTVKAKENLDKLVAVFKEYPDTNLSVVGHTDSVGSDAINDKLSLQRATSVRDYLIANGIDAARLSTDGKGKKEPIADNATDEGRAANRRVEFAITANDKMIEDAKQGN